MLQKIWSKLKLISAILACAVFLGAGLYGVLTAIVVEVTDGACARVSWKYEKQWDQPLVISVSCRRPFTISLDNGQTLNVFPRWEPKGDIALQAAHCSWDIYGICYTFVMDPEEAVTVDLHGAKGEVSLEYGGKASIVSGWNVRKVRLSKEGTVSLTGGKWFGTKYSLEFLQYEDGPLQEEPIQLAGRCKGDVTLTLNGCWIDFHADCPTKWQAYGYCVNCMYNYREELVLPEDARIEYLKDRCISGKQHYRVHAESLQTINEL